MGWFRSWVLGGPYRTIGTVQAERRLGFNHDVHVHVLNPTTIGQPPRVSLELVTKAFLAYDRRPITLTKQQASELVRLLQQAVASSGLTSA